MAERADRLAFLAEPTRLKIAGWCESESLSREEIAKRLGRPSGGLSAPETMLRRGALVSDGFGAAGRSGRRPELLRLDAAWRKPLAEALQRRPPGGLEPGTDLLLIPLVETESACAAIARGELETEWGARLEGEHLGLILSPRHDPQSRATIRAIAALDRAGVRAARVRLQDLMAPDELREWANIVCGTDPPELPRRAS
jgi:hypothetical protein